MGDGREWDDRDNDSRRFMNNHRDLTRGEGEEY